MKITIIGTGYVGLVTGACLAELGNDVFCLDLDQNKIAILNGGGIPIHEPGLEDIVKRNRVAGRLKFSTDVKASVAHGEIQFIAVGTPQDEDGSADLQYVLAAARNIGKNMNGFKVIIDKWLDHIPLERQVRILERHGLVVTSQTLWDLAYAAQALTISEKNVTVIETNRLLKM